MKKRILALALGLILAFSLASGALGAGPLPGYTDRLGDLDQGQQRSLFEGVLGKLASLRGELDPARMTDGEKLDLVFYLSLVQFPGTKPDLTVPEGELQGFLWDRFGTTVSLAPFAVDILPTQADRERAHCYYNGNLYLRVLTRQTAAGFLVTPQHLYQLGDSRYCAVFGQRTGGGEEVRHAAVVEKNAGGEWRVLRLFPAGAIPDLSQLKEYGQPSSWAQEEIKYAQRLGLIPTLTNDPGYQGCATRIQFAQLAVRLTEVVLGRSLTPADEGVFTDCSDPSVLKAYAAGIVNGVGDGRFDPDGLLNREQLATMLWRAVEHLEKETGRAPLAPAQDLSRFYDGRLVSSWAVSGVAALAEADIMKGDGAGMLQPGQSCTVEQAILLTTRAYEKIK